MNNSAQTDRDLRQWVIWPPAMAALIGLILGGYLVRAVFIATAWQLAYALLALFVVWCLLPRFAFKLWREGDALCWRWGQLHRGPLHSLPLADIAVVEVGTLPDKPALPFRTLAGMEVHGGNFTPSLNRGVKLTTRDGRVIWLGLPQPEKFATALQNVLPTPITTP
ncbi:hypothetical protein [Chitinimonas naiadis]